MAYVCGPSGLTLGRSVDAVDAVDVVDVVDSIDVVDVVDGIDIVDVVVNDNRLEVLQIA